MQRVVEATFHEFWSMRIPRGCLYKPSFICCRELQSGVVDILGLPGNLRPIAIVPNGYPSRIPKAPPRTTMDEAAAMVR